MVSAEYAVGHLCLIKYSHSLICVFPLVCHIAVINDITCMDNIPYLLFCRIVYYPVVDIEEMVLPFFGVILGIRFPCKAEIVILRGCVAGPVCVYVLFAIKRGFKVRNLAVRSALYNNIYLTIGNIILYCNICIGYLSVLVGRRYFVPFTCRTIYSIHCRSSCIVCIGRFTVPRKVDYVIFACISYIKRIFNVRLNAVRGFGCDIFGLYLLSLIELHRCVAVCF